MKMNNYTDKQYQYCVSLGWFCATASALQRYGLRSSAGPFDWMISDFDSVLQVMENNFCDYMSKENLREKEDNINVIVDTKYGFEYPHDIRTNLEEDYPEIYKRYQRRIDRFRNETQRKSLFFRVVKSDEEIEYIIKNKEYIYSVIKKGNIENEIIFIIYKKMKPLPEYLNWYRIEDEKYSADLYKMRTIFDSEERLVEYCKTKIFSRDKLTKNKVYDRQKLTDSQKNSLVCGVLEDTPKTIGKILQTYYNDSMSKVYLYGAGDYGLRILQCMKMAGIQVIAFIDTNREKHGNNIEGVPVIGMPEKLQEDSAFFVSVYSLESSNDIVEQVKKKYPNILVVTLVDLYEYLDI